MIVTVVFHSKATDQHLAIRLDVNDDQLHMLDRLEFEVKLAKETGEYDDITFGVITP